MSSKHNGIRRVVFERDKYRCHYCGLGVEDARIARRKATIDHKHPRCRGGTWAFDNLVTACQFCNSEKGSMPYEMFRWYKHMRARGYERWELLQAIETVQAEMCGRIARTTEEDDQPSP